MTQQIEDQFDMEAETHFKEWFKHAELDGNTRIAFVLDPVYRALWKSGYMTGVLKTKQSTAPDEDLDDPMDWLFDEDK